MLLRGFNLGRSAVWRSPSGTSLSEVAPMVWVLFILLTFPLINLATIGLRYTFVVTATRDAAAAAAKGKQFEASTSQGDPPVKTIASETAQRELASFRGLKFVGITTSILTTDLQTKQFTRTTTRLPAPADTSRALYNIEVKLDALVEPLINLGGGMLPNVPGVSAPMAVSVVSQRYADNPQGLNR